MNFLSFEGGFPIQDISRGEDEIFIFSLDQNVNFFPQKESRVIYSGDFENLDAFHILSTNSMSKKETSWVI